MANVKYTATFPLNVPTRNGRIYTSEAMKNAIQDEYIQESISRGTLVGCFPPQAPDSCNPLNLGTNPMDAAISIRSLKCDDEKLTAEFETLPTPSANILERIIEEGPLSSFSLAPRILGEIESNGVVNVKKIISFDLCSQPQKEE